MHVYCTKKAAMSGIVIFCIFVFTVSAALFASSYGSNLFTGAKSGDKKTVIIDPGHGEPDGGAVGVDGVIEKDINLSISLKLKSFFVTAGYTVIMTREDDNAIYDKGSDTIRKKKVTDLHNRLSIVNSHPDAIFISIHQNIYRSSNKTGSIVFYSPNNENSKVLAQSVQISIADLIQPENNRDVCAAKKKISIFSTTRSRPPSWLSAASYPIRMIAGSCRMTPIKTKWHSQYFAGRLNLRLLNKSASELFSYNCSLSDVMTSLRIFGFTSKICKKGL